MVRSAGEESPWKLILNFRLWSSPSPCTGASGRMKTLQFPIQGLSPRSVPSTEHLIYCLEECLPTQRGHPSHAQTHMSVGVTLRTVEGTWPGQRGWAECTPAGGLQPMGPWHLWALTQDRKLITSRPRNVEQEVLLFLLTCECT